MNQNIKSGITFGVIGGLLTFLFGGWSVAVISVPMALGLGLSLGPRLPRQKPMSLALAALPAAAVSAIILVALSLLQNFVIQPAIGKSSSSGDIVVAANLVALVASI